MNVQHPFFAHTLLRTKLPMTILPFSSQLADLGRIADVDRFCAEAREQLLAYRSAAFYLARPQRALFVLSIETRSTSHWGLLALNALADLAAGRILPHEQTLVAKEHQQLALFRQWEAMPKPALLTFAPVPEWTRTLEAVVQDKMPVCTADFPLENQRHRFWAIEAATEVAYLQGVFAKVPRVYIADGHHRVTALRQLHGEEALYAGIFCAYFPADQVRIGDYNRVVRLPSGFMWADFWEKLGQIFDLTPQSDPVLPETKHLLGIYGQGRWYRATWKPALLAQVDAPRPLLDVDLLNRVVLEAALHIGNVRTSADIAYVEGARGPQGVQIGVDQRGGDAVGFVLYPVSFPDLAAWADAGRVLPPKSTYFEPRIKSGLVLADFEQ